MRVIFLSFLMLFVQAGYALETPSDAPDFVYEVKPGDTLSKLSHDLLAETARWKDVAAYNKLKDPHRITPKQVLRIKQPWMKTPTVSALPLSVLKVEGVSGAATVDGRALKLGDEVPVGAKLATPAEAALSLRLPDGSLVNLMENSQLEVEKLDVQAGERFSSLFRLVTGQIEAFKRKYPEGQANMSVRAKTATIGVRGTRFRMRQDDQNTYAEIEEGLVGLDAVNRPTVLVLAGGYGAVSDGVRAVEAIPLLPAPTFPKLPSVFDMPFVEWTMPELSGSIGFIGELARNETFSNRLVTVRGDGRKIRLNELPNGEYWMRLRAVDKNGLQGTEAKVAFKVNAPVRKFPMTKTYISGETLQLRWVGRKESASYQVQVADNLQFQRNLLDVNTDRNVIEIPRPKSGRYFMRVRQMYGPGQSVEWDVPSMFEAPR
ncbi:MAG: FecR domain-containing protein [Sideroxydans sp.]|nr:FecR domain-containing protein [Sideroxydans sp.]